MYKSMVLLFLVSAWIHQSETIGSFFEELKDAYFFGSPSATHPSSKTHKNNVKVKDDLDGFSWSTRSSSVPHGGNLTTSTISPFTHKSGVSSSSSSSGRGYGHGHDHGGYGHGGYYTHHNYHNTDHNMDLYSLLGGLGFASLLGATIIFLARRNTSGRRRRRRSVGLNEEELEDTFDDDYEYPKVKLLDLLSNAEGSGVSGSEPWWESKKIQ